MESLKDHAVPIISGLLVLNGVGYGFIWRSIVNQVRSNTEEIKAYSRLHFECQKMLPEKFVTVQVIRDFTNKLGIISEKLANLPVIYRTKEEANKDWRILEARLTELQAAIKNLGDSNIERHREMWEKLNRVVDEFRSNRNLILQRQMKMEEIVYTEKERIELERQARQLEQMGNHNILEGEIP